MKVNLSFILVLVCFSCKKQQPIKIQLKKENFVERADSINEFFLSRAVYDTALYYNNSPVHNGGFLLNEKVLAFGLAGLNNSFTEKEKLMPIPVKEVTWKLNDIDFITVWYKEVDNVFTPIDTEIYNRGTHY